MIPGLAQLGPRRRSNRQQQQQQQELERQATEEHRSRHHHHHYHHHHHHHHSRPRTANRFQHGVDPPTQGSEAASSSRPMDPLSSYPTSHDRLYQARLPFSLQRRSQTEAHRVALEARGRLDERLREATFLGRRAPDSSLPRLAHYYFNALFPDEDEESLWGDEHELEPSLSEWLAGRVSGFRESWQPEWMNDLPPSSPIQGLSKAAVNAIPREIYGQKAAGKWKSSDDQQVECSVCLEQFAAGQSLLCLPCKHKFHPACLTPWLEQHEQCPYCRAQIHSSGSSGGSKREEDFEADNLLAWLEAFETGMSRMRFNANSINR